MPSLPQFLMAKSIVFRFPALWTDNRTEGRNRKQNETPIIQKKMVRNLLLHLDMHKSMGPNRIHPEVPRELGKELTNHLPGVVAHQRDPNWVEVSKCDAHLQEMLEGGSRELRACQPELVSGKAMEQIILSAINGICRTARGSGPASAGLWKGSCLNSLISFLWEGDPSVGEGKAVDAVYLDFSNAFDTTSWRKWPQVVPGEG